MATPIPAPHGIVFDRRLPEPLLEALSPDGVLAGLTDLVTSADAACAADVGLRGYVKSALGPGERPRSGRVTLYVGTTMAAHVCVRDNGMVRLQPQKGTQLAKLGPLDVPFEWKWKRWRRPADLQQDWPRILEHLAEVVRITPPGRLKEGKIQASLTRLASDFSIIDREVVLSHETKDHRSSVRAGLRSWVDDVLAQGGDGLPPGRPKSFGNKLDALGLDDGGRLLVIEVKPATELNGTAWTPLQVSVYQHLFSAWLQDASERAVEVIEGMLDDRVQLGILDPATRSRLQLRPELPPRPVIALGAHEHKREDLLDTRFNAVRTACRDAGAPLEELAVWSVSDDGIEPHQRLN